MPNRLAGETSPYLLQHKDNPVDWYPWGEEALGRARREDRPILVSIGYSACHWCHVMERESFEDPQIAALMNEHFVCIKVDREERPDVDAIYMEAVQAMTGQGGWPLNAFLTPEQAPFYAGTYYPPASRPGFPSWRMVLEAIAEAWSVRRSEVRRAGAQAVEALGATARIRPAEEPVTEAVLTAAVATARRAYDEANGGFGGAPKFPPSAMLEFLLARGEQQMSLSTLRAMARGGIYDQIGGGFARYAVDARWTVPHFEKMLYDNAQLARAYLHGWQRSGDPQLRRVCTETLDFVLRELRGPEGGFLAALDADSEGVEGKFYVWTLAELDAAIGDPALAAAAVGYFGASERGNFEGANILEARGPEPAEADRLEIRRRLLAARSQRVRPGLDDKRLTSWNALAISAFARAGAALGEDRYRDAAVTGADFVLSELRDEQGRLLRTWKDGRARLAGYLEDHAFLLGALLDLYEATFDRRWYHEAIALADTMLGRFADPEHGGFFTTANDHEELAVRRKDLEDTPIPSGSSAAAVALLRLARLSGAAAYEQAAASVLRLLHPLAARHPLSFGSLLTAIDFHLARVREVAIVGGEGAEALLAVVRASHRPHLVLAAAASDHDATESGVPLLEHRTPIGGRAAAYVCEHFACRAPVTEPDALAALLRGAPAAGGSGPGARAQAGAPR